MRIIVNAFMVIVLTWGCPHAAWLYCTTEWHFSEGSRDVMTAGRYRRAVGEAARDASIYCAVASTMRFVRDVDSSSAMINASTRFADSFEYGLGAEIGISTDRLHARGPVDLPGLTSQKHVVFGDVQVRA